MMIEVIYIYIYYFRVIWSINRMGMKISNVKNSATEMLKFKLNNAFYVPIYVFWPIFYNKY